VVLVDESLDGAPRDARVAEAAVQAALGEAGVTLIDAAQSRKIRSVTDAGTLMEGTVPDVITALDADVIVAGRSRIQRVQNDLLGPRVHSADAALSLRLIAVDDGHVLGLLDAQAQAVGFSAQQAADKAARQAVQAVKGELLAKLQAGATPGRLELTVTGIPHVTASERVITGLQQVPGVQGVTVLQAGRGRTKVEIQAPGASARTLAAAIDGAQGLGLSVIGYSRRAITAEYSPAHALHLNMVLTPFRAAGGGKTKAGKGGAKPGSSAWRGRALARVLGVAASNLAFVRLHADGRPASLPGSTPRAWAKGLKRMGLAPTQTILARGTYARRGGARFEVTASLVAASTGAVLVAGRRTCPTAALGDCVGDLASGLADKLLPAVLAKRGAFRGALPQRLVAQGSEGAAATSQRALRVAKMTVEPLFPARLSTYADHPVGSLTLENTSRAAVRDVVVSVTLPGFAREALDIPVGTLKPRAKKVVPLKVVLDRAALVGHDANGPAVLSATARYVTGRGADALQGEVRRSKAVLVYGRNVVSWAEPDSVASFVTPKTPAVQALAGVLNTVKPAGPGAASAPSALTAPPALRTAAAALGGMGALGVRYKADPASPFGSEALDYAQFPEQTLSKRAGDCDDLAILFASLTEGAGLRTLLLVTPDHVFAAVDTGLPPRAADTLSLTAGRTLTHDGTLWVPLETTLVGHPFDEIWAGGAKALARWSAKPQAIHRVDLRAAWTRFPAESLVPQDAETVPTLGDAQVQALRQELATWGEGWASARAQELDAAIRTARVAKDEPTPPGRVRLARLLVLRGRLDQARQTLQGLDDPGALNALGNIALLAAAPKDALRDYDRALAAKPDARVHLNAAIAAHALGDDDTFAEHVFACVELGAEDAVVRLARAGVSGGARGADAGARASSAATSADLGAAIRAAYERRGRKLPPGAAAKDGARASDASAGRPDVVPFLYWL